MVPDFQEKIKSRGGWDIFWPLAVFLGIIAAFGALRLAAVRSEPGVEPAFVHQAFPLDLRAPEAGQRAFVASKNGKNYYPAGCAAARRIKEENRIYFPAVEDAERAGFARSKSCR